MSAWHWQERYDAVDPEQACRLQVLQIQKEIPFSKWLQLKKANRAKTENDSVTEIEEEEEKRRECDKRFREWVRDKQRQKKQAQSQKSELSAGGRPALKRDDQPFTKPPSLHVNPRIKRARAGGVKTQHSNNDNKHLTKPAPPDQCMAAYKEWERRKLREDPIKRKDRQLNQLLQEHAQRLRHLTIWKKKDVVCAYSTNRRSTDRALTTTNKLRAA